MMDKKTILVVIGCIATLILWQKLVDKLYPPTPKPVRIIETNAPAFVATTAPSITETGVVEEVAEAMEEPAGPRPDEQIIALANEFVRVEFTTCGGGVRSVELLKHKANGHGNVVLNGSNSVPALAIKGIRDAGADGAFTAEQLDARTVLMRTRTRAGGAVTKKFTLGDGYVINGTVEIAETPTNATNTQAVELVVGTAAPASGRELPDFLSVGWLAGDKYQYRDLKRVTKNVGNNIHGEATDAHWASVKNQFFAMILTPATNVVAVGYEHVEVPPLPDWTGKQPPAGLSASATILPTSTSNAGTQTYAFDWYAGPKEYERLAALGKDQEEVMQFGFWGAISVVLLKSMKFFHHVIPNYGIAIILVTIVIKLLFWPIQAKSIKSMKAMQQFQPQMQKLREKYKDDAQRLNAEMMKLYKEHKINPFAGCLPMVVQIPVFFALFTMLRSAIELRGAGFLWIKDLSQPDTIFSLAGLPINPLPVIMTAASIGQMKLTPQSGDNQQQKMMQFMPLIFLFMFYSMSSGLVLYWTVQQLLSVAQQWWSLRQANQPGPTAASLPAGKAK